ncbi:MAG TPA: Rid family detoxifying hydrolase [Candidatus Saccharimonadales bacterium]|jgi:2-iminobutanoate/2-iminopropanoate deaminase|nr:Rid family detoxifying hydrolase [Candidatus Saccharimonadales bacterium]
MSNAAEDAVGAPKKYGPYSVVRKAGPFVFVSGQIGINPQTGAASADVSEQTLQALANVASALGTVGLGLEHVVDTTVFLTNMADFEAVNKAYAGQFSEPYPSRACVGVAGLPHVGDVPLRVEIKVIAMEAAA